MPNHALKKFSKWLIVCVTCHIIPFNLPVEGHHLSRLEDNGEMHYGAVEWAGATHTLVMLSKLSLLFKKTLTGVSKQM